MEDKLLYSFSVPFIKTVATTVEETAKLICSKYCEQIELAGNKAAIETLYKEVFKEINKHKGNGEEN